MMILASWYTECHPRLCRLLLVSSYLLPMFWWVAKPQVVASKETNPVDTVYSNDSYNLSRFSILIEQSH